MRIEKTEGERIAEKKENKKKGVRGFVCLFVERRRQRNKAVAAIRKKNKRRRNSLSLHHHVSYQLPTHSVCYASINSSHSLMFKISLVFSVPLS